MIFKFTRNLLQSIIYRIEYKRKKFRINLNPYD